MSESKRPTGESIMTRNTSVAVAALTTAVGLLLTACGGDGSAGDSGKIQGAGAVSTSPSASASPIARDTERPDIKLPASFTMTFEGWSNSNPTLQAIMNDGKEAVRAIHAAVIDGELHADYVAFYNVGSALRTDQEWIKGLTDNNRTLTGKVRVYDPQVRVSSEDGSGTLFYCLDQSKGYAKDLKTNKVIVTAASKNDYVLYQTKLTKNKQGVWRTTTISTTQGACKA